MIEHLTIKNPKRENISSGRANWFPYYAGYSPNFVAELIRSANLVSREICIADPWNGGGTTTTVAHAMGYRTKGLDLNPVMGIAAKACLLNNLDIPSLKPLLNEILSKANSSKTLTHHNDDPILAWLQPSSAQYLRKIEHAIRRILVQGGSNSKGVFLENGVEKISSIACFSM